MIAELHAQMQRVDADNELHTLSVYEGDIEVVVDVRLRFDLWSYLAEFSVTATDEWGECEVEPQQVAALEEYMRVMMREIDKEVLYGSAV